VRSKRGCVARILSAWNVEPYPITCQKIEWLGAGLKAGGYRSCQNILSQYRVDGERRGEALDSATLRVFKDVGRSCVRGLGPPLRAAPLPFERLAELQGSAAPWTAKGPICPRNVLVTGAWWLLRESELSNLRARMVSLRMLPRPTISLTLAASKSDQTAAGATRAHACTCQAGSVYHACPAHTVWDQLWALKRRWPQRFAGEVPDWDLPLFPDADGRPVSKAAMVATIVAGARALQVPLRSADALTRISGHSLRCTGAQGLARLGIDTWTIQLLGRWGSAAVQAYVREASAGPEAAAARSSLLRQSLADLASGAAVVDSAACIDAAVKRTVADAMAQAAPGLAAELGASLRRDLSAEIDRRVGAQAADTSTSESTSESEGPPAQAEVAADPPALYQTTVVASTLSRKQHAIWVGPKETSDATSWVTKCGWKFGLTTTAREATAADEHCRKCWPF